MSEITVVHGWTVETESADDGSQGERAASPMGHIVILSTSSPMVCSDCGEEIGAWTTCLIYYKRGEEYVLQQERYDRTASQVVHLEHQILGLAETDLTMADQ